MKIFLYTAYDITENDGTEHKYVIKSDNYGNEFKPLASLLDIHNEKLGAVERKMKNHEN
jgi:hypothetical protein